MAAPTSQELQHLSKFRQNLHDLKLEGFWNTDLGLLQWLRARDLKLDQAETMIRKSMKWRDENGMDSILNWECPSAFSTLSPVEFCGLDKENCPVCFIPFGSWEGRKLVNLGHRESIVRYVMQMFEKLRAQGENKFLPTGEPVTQYILLIDAKGLSMQTLACMGAINMYMEALRSMEANYPETVKKIVVVNASRIFTAFFNLVKPIMSQRTFAKVHVFNNNCEKWMTPLLQDINMDQLPPKLIEYWHSSKNYQNSPRGSDGSTTSDYVEMTVAPGQEYLVEIDVQTLKSVLSWSFTTKDYDIGFGLTMTTKSNEFIEEEVIPHQIVKSHQKKQEGILVCDQIGTYKFLFDNSASRLRGKVLKYRIELADAE